MFNHPERHLVDNDSVRERADVKVCSICNCLVVGVGGSRTDPLSLLPLHQLPQDEHLPLQVVASDAFLVLYEYLQAKAALRQCNKAVHCDVHSLHSLIAGKTLVQIGYDDRELAAGAQLK